MQSAEDSIESSPRLSVDNIHCAFLEALDGAVLSNSSTEDKPLDVDLAAPLPSKVRLYIYNATFPPGGRAMGEHKIQIIVPGQERGRRGNFDRSGGRIPLLAGYRADLEVFILWDADRYVDFAYSRNVQVKAETVYAAFAQGLARQTRRLANQPDEIVIAARAARLRDALLERQSIMLGGK